MMLFGCITWAILGGSIFISLIVLAVLDLVDPRFSGVEEFLGNIFGLCFSIICLGFVVFAVIYLIWKYKCVVDIYQNDKVIRMNGKKLKYIVYYNNIVGIKEGAFGFFYIFCREPIIIQGKKKGPKTIIECYKKADIYFIKRIIGNSNFNLISN